MKSLSIYSIAILINLLAGMLLASDSVQDQTSDNVSTIIGSGATSTVSPNDDCQIPDVDLDIVTQKAKEETDQNALHQCKNNLAIAEVKRVSEYTIVRSCIYRRTLILISAEATYECIQN